MAKKPAKKRKRWVFGRDFDAWALEYRHMYGDSWIAVAIQKAKPLSRMPVPGGEWVRVKFAKAK